MSHPLWTQERGSIHHAFLVIPPICRFPLCPKWSKHHNLSVRVTDLYTISTSRRCVCRVFANSPLLMTCWPSASLNMCGSERVGDRMWSAGPFIIKSHLVATEKNSSRAGPPFREHSVRDYCVSLPFDPGQNVASQFSFHVIAASIAHALLHCCGPQIALNMYVNVLSPWGQLSIICLKCTGGKLQPSSKSFSGKNISNLQQIFYLVVWE